VTYGPVRDDIFTFTPESRLRIVQELARGPFADTAIRAYLHPVTSWAPEHRFPELELELACGPERDGTRGEGTCQGHACAVDAMFAETVAIDRREYPWTWQGPWPALRYRFAEAGYDATVGCPHRRKIRCTKNGRWTDEDTFDRCLDCGKRVRRSRRRGRAAA
jgi:hypothetical protein